MDALISALRPVRFRGKYRVMSLFAPKQGIRSASIFGYRMDLDLSDWIQRHIYYGSYEQPQTSRMLSYVRPGMTFVDVGANVGYYSALASSIVGGGRVIAYEPNPYAFERLQAWIQANQVNNVTPVFAALGAKQGTIKTHFYETDNHTASLVPPADPATQETTAVEVRTLDAEADRLGLDRIDVMKIDVDGYESEVFRGAAGLLTEGRINAILCEFSAHWLAQVGSSNDELEQLFTSRGYIKRAVFGTESLGDRWFVRA